jgi:signal recognition particle subunit SEC65
MKDMVENFSAKSLEEALNELSLKYNIPDEIKKKIVENKVLVEKALQTISANETPKSGKEVQHDKRS